MGFTNDVTVAVWVGYDNADGKRRTLGGGATGGSVAVPIFESVIEAVWASGAPKAALAPPSPEARRELACKSVGPKSGDVPAAGKALAECRRIDAKDKVGGTENRLQSRDGAQAGGRARTRPRVRQVSDDGYSSGGTAQWGSSWGYQQGWRGDGARSRQPTYSWGGWR